MHDDRHHDTTNGHDQSRALRDVAEGLDRLAHAERAEPNADFEHRLSRTARPGVAASIGKGTAQGASPRRLWWALPLAAALALAALVIIPTTRPGTTPIVGPQATTKPQSSSIVTVAMLEAEFEDFLFVDGFATSQSVTDQSMTARSIDGTLGSNEDTTDEILFDLLDGAENSL